MYTRSGRRKTMTVPPTRAYNRQASATTVRAAEAIPVAEMAARTRSRSSSSSSSSSSRHSIVDNSQDDSTNFAQAMNDLEVFDSFSDEEQETALEPIILFPTKSKTKNGEPGEMMFNDGFFYLTDRKYDERRTWKCKESVKLSCTARATSFGPKGGFGPVDVRGEHNHLPVPEMKDVAAAEAEIKRLAASTKNNPRDIIQDACKNVKPEAKGYLRANQAYTRMIHLIRSSKPMFGPAPKTLADLVVDEKHQVTLENEKFLYYDSGAADKNRMLIFTTAANLRQLSRCAHWFSDGTFDSAPKIFTQLFTVHGQMKYERQKKIKPLVYALFTNKKEETYRKFFNWLKNQLTPYKNYPLFFTTDFELGELKVITDTFPTAEVHGCYFHLTQTWKRHCYTKLGLKAVFETYERHDIRKSFREAKALSFVPLVDLCAAFDIVQSQAPDEMKPFYLYLEKYFLGKKRRNGERKTPPFKPALWSNYNAVLAESQRTNNSVESWHGKFEASTGRQPTPAKLFAQLQTEQSSTETVIEQLRAGTLVTTTNKDQVRLDEALLARCRAYDVAHLTSHIEDVAALLKK